MSGDFYVGYAARAPHALRLWLRPRIALVLAGAALGAVALVVAQRPFAHAIFEYGRYRTYEGSLIERPYARLQVPGRDGAPAASYWLAAPGKRGAAALAAGRGGSNVRLEAALIERAGIRMLEVLPDTLVRLPAGSPPSPPGARLELGPARLRGEIVDSKCWLGVMNPGQGKVHRGCAARCLSGGSPPMLVTRDAVIVLAARDGGPLPGPAVAALAAEPVTIDGELARHGDTLILRTAMPAIRRAERE